MDIMKIFGLDSLPPPVDRNQKTLLDGSSVGISHTEIGADGMQKNYAILSDAERAKGYARPLRHTYIHNRCGASTTMASALAETYARDPEFYTETYCCACKKHFPVGPDGEFNWADGGEKVGS